MQEAFQLNPAETVGEIEEMPRATTARNPSRIATVDAILADAAGGAEEYVTGYNVLRGAE